MYTVQGVSVHMYTVQGVSVHMYTVQSVSVHMYTVQGVSENRGHCQSLNFKPILLSIEALASTTETTCIYISGIFIFILSPIRG